jgi:hypothetical protein
MCEQHDDHPKHVFVLDVTTGEEARRHMDCCASVGCTPCAQALIGSNGAKGHELRQHLMQGPQAAVSVTPELPTTVQTPPAAPADGGVA